jgi:hypothetical protein
VRFAQKDLQELMVVQEAEAREQAISDLHAFIKLAL